MKHNFLRRTTALVLALCMALSMTVMAGAAETDPAPTDPPAAKEAHLDLKLTRTVSTLTAQVSIDKNTASFASMQVQLHFDAKLLEYVRVTPGNTGMKLITNSEPNVDSRLNVVAAGSKDFTGTGVLYTAEFKIKEAGERAALTLGFDQAWSMLDSGDKLTFAADQTAEKPADPTLSGTVTSFLSEQDSITVDLIPAAEGQQARQQVLTGNTAQYSFPKMAPGVYTLRLSKNRHVTREYTVELKEKDVTLDVEIVSKGDVNADGQVNTLDWMKVYNHLKSTAPLTGYALLCADVVQNEGDAPGTVNSADWARIYDHAKERNSIW